MGLPQKLITHLGPIQGGWPRGADGNSVPFQVGGFTCGPRPGTVTFATLGLSKVSLLSRATGKAGAAIRCSTTTTDIPFEWTILSLPF